MRPETGNPPVQGVSRSWPFIAYLATASFALIVALNRYLPADNRFDHTSVEFGISYAITLAILFGASCFPRIGYWIVSYVVVGAALEKYTVSIGINEPKFLLLDLMDSSWRELSGFFSLELGCAFVALAALSVGTVGLAVRMMPNALGGALRALGWRERLAFLAVAIGLLGSGVFMRKPLIEEDQEKVVQAALWPIYHNLQNFRIMKGYFVGEMQFAKKLDQLPAATSVDSVVDSDSENTVVVFVFGESVRGSHWGLNGYERNTTPRLAKESGLVNFPDTLSFGTYTQVSAIGMMTPTTYRNPVPVGPSFVDFFVKHGFEGWSFTSSRPTSVQRKLTHSIENRVNRIGEAMDLLPFIDDALSRGKERRQFFYIYTEGNHFPYNRGYPPEFSRFQPDDHGRWNLAAEQEKVINAYDNAIVYTDAFLSEIIGRLKGRRAVLIYVSDHGDALGEDGRYIRGGTMFDEYLRRVAFFVWASPQYRVSRPEIMRSLDANASIKVSHDHLFPTVMSLGGISSPLSDAALDLTKGGVRPRDFEAQNGPPIGSVFHIDR